MFCLLKLQRMKFDDATLSTLFLAANALPLPVWFLMMFLPSWRVTQAVVRSRITSVLISVLFVVLNVLFFTTVMEDKFEVEGFFSLDIIAHAFKIDSSFSYAGFTTWHLTCWLVRGCFWITMITIDLYLIC
jgi:hypothetical protein